MAKITIDTEACIGCGVCVGTYPDAFDFNADGKATVKGDLDDSSAEDAIASCAVGAISK